MNGPRETNRRVSLTRPPAWSSHVKNCEVARANPVSWCLYKCCAKSVLCTEYGVQCSAFTVLFPSLTISHNLTDCTKSARSADALHRHGTAHPPNKPSQRDLRSAHLWTGQMKRWAWLPPPARSCLMHRAPNNPTDEGTQRASPVDA